MGSAIGMGLGVLLIVLLIPLVIMAFMYVCLWKIYVKLGYPGWSALVPGYSLWIVAEDFFGPVFAGINIALIAGGTMVSMAVGGSTGLLIGSLMSIIGCVMWMVVWYHVVRALGHGVWFFIGCLFFSIVFYPILAFERFQGDDMNYMEV